jgi:6-pyruvoyltetrahydropterin/6-carboxytetrahydropterin synthase
MYSLTIEGNFSSAHQLRGYKGKCENLHGHNWKVVLTVKGEKLNGIGILIDFHELKDILKESLAGLDHICINEHPAFLIENPSSENISCYIFRDISQRLHNGGHHHVVVESLTVYESETARCTYTEER